MTPTCKFIKKPASRDEWLALRKPYLGGSDIAAMLGLSPWRTPYQLWAEKTGRVVDDKPKNQLALDLGSHDEEFMAKRYQATTGRIVRNFGYMICDDVHHVCADIDRLVVPDEAKVAAYHDEIRTDTLLEVKTSKYVWDEEVPAYYQTQVQTYLALTGCVHADMAVLFREPTLTDRYPRVERNDGQIDLILAKAKEWWERHVLADVAPDPIDEEDCRRKFSHSRGGTEIVATPRIMEVIEILKSAQARADKAEEDVGKCRAEIFAHMGEADTLMSADNPALKVATWRSGKDRETTDWKATLAAVLEEYHVPQAAADQIARRFTTTKPGARVFRLASK